MAGESSVHRHPSTHTARRQLAGCQQWGGALPWQLLQLLFNGQHSALNAKEAKFIQEVGQENLRFAIELSSKQRKQ